MSAPHQELLERMQDTASAVDTLADWVGVNTLVLDRVTATTNYHLGEVNRTLLRPHPGVLYGYRRTALLRTPETWEAVASVEAVVLTSRLPRHAVGYVIDAKSTLGSVLRELGAHREFIRSTVGGRTDAAGRPVGLRVEARFLLNGPDGPEPVALVREDVYEDVIRARDARMSS